MAKSQKRTAVTYWPSGSRDIQEWVGKRNWALVEGDERDPDQPLPVFISTSKTPDGRLVCGALIVGVLPSWSASEGGEITARFLRSLHLPELVATARALEEMPDDFGAAVRAMNEASPVLRPGPRGHRDEHFIEVARLYRLAMEANPRAPMKHLAEQLDRPDVTVRRWVQRARDKGFLGPSTPGRAGEQPKKGRR